jgi:hypothetical protein
MRTLGFLGFAALFVSAPCIAQTAKVTFYSPSMTRKEAAKILTVPVGTAPFYGWIYDMDKKLANIWTGKFVTFSFDPGKHTFSPSKQPDKSPKSALELDLQNGETYCVRLTMKYESTIVLPVGFSQARFTQIPCAQAKQEAQRLKALAKKRVDKDALANWDSSQEFPKQ